MVVTAQIYNLIVGNCYLTASETLQQILVKSSSDMIGTKKPNEISAETEIVSNS